MFGARAARVTRVLVTGLLMAGAPSACAKGSNGPPAPAAVISTTPGPASAGHCGTHAALRGSDPAVVVVLLDGSTSKQRGGRWQPLATSMCPLDAAGHETAWPVGAIDGLRRFSLLSAPTSSYGSVPFTSDACHLSGGFDHGACFTAEVARAGAVMIPYSYEGTTLSGHGRAAVVTATKYDAPVTVDDVNPLVQRLGAQIASIEAAWPKAYVVLVGHSWGGMLAERWWEAHRGARRDPHVWRVFSLDGIVNGVRSCQRQGLSHTASQQCASWWSTRNAHDQRISRLDADGSYVPIGTVHDPAYADDQGGGDIRSQVLYSCDDTSRCLLPPSIVSPCPVDRPIYGTSGHETVKSCPSILARIAGQVRKAATAKAPA